MVPPLSINGTHLQTTTNNNGCSSIDRSHQSRGMPDNLRENLKTRARNDFSRHYGTQRRLEIRRLEMYEEHKNVNDKVQMLSIGQKTNCPTKVILVVGATGGGKTTLINAMVNFIFGIDFDDDFRLILIDDENAPKRSEAESQTDFITAYAFYQLPGMPFNYNYVLIDTPGFANTRGIQRDREMMKQLETFLKQDYGIDQVDGVGFVTPASAGRLTQTQRYVYDGLSSMFGKDIKDNIYVMATFAYAITPPVLKVLKEAGVEYGGFYKFNNSALFAQNTAANDGSSDDSDTGDDDAACMCKLFWEMGYKSMDHFFLKLGKTSPASLALTREVLDERNCLQAAVTCLQTQIHLASRQRKTNKEGIIYQIKKVQRHLEKLDEIALKQDFLSSKEYITLMIESAKMQKRHGFEKRLEMLQKVKEEAAILQCVKGIWSLISEDALLRYFQEVMTK